MEIEERIEWSKVERVRVQRYDEITKNKIKRKGISIETLIGDGSREIEKSMKNLNKRSL